MSAVALPVRQQTDAWLEARRDGIGSSDMPVIMGNRDGLIELWAIKVRRMEPEPPDAAMQLLFDLGHRLEPVLADLYTEREGRPLKRVNRMLAHPEIPWAYASLDRVSGRRGERRIVELKFAPHRRWSEGVESVPAAVQDQVQWQCLVGGYDVVDIAVLEGSRFTVYEVGRDDSYIDDLLYTARWFRDLVERDVPPPIADGSAATHRALKRLFPAGDGEPIVLDGDDPVLDDLARRWRRLQTQKASADRELSAVKAAVKALLGESAGVLSESNGYRLNWKRTRAIDWQAIALELEAPADLVAMHTSTDWKAVAETLRPRAKVIDAHASLSDSRRLTASFKGMQADGPEEESGE